MTRSVLFIINGLGMGNSTRCYAVMQKLKNYDVTIDVATSNNGMGFFTHTPEIRNVYPLRAFNYGKSKGRLSMIATLENLPRILKTYIKNYRFLRSLVLKTRPSAIVIDSEYGFIPSPLRPIPVLAINNSDVIVRHGLSWTRLPVSLWPQFFLVECLDFVFHHLVPVKVISPALTLPKKRSKGKFVAVPPIVREHIVPQRPRENVELIAIMLSCSDFGMNVDPASLGLDYRFEVIGREGENTNTITYHGRTLDNIGLLKQADVLVINGGFSAVSEAVMMQKPVVVVPVQNHSEQFINAKKVEDLGLGYMAQEGEIREKLMLLIATYKNILQRYESYCPGRDGADQAASIILDTLAGRGIPLHEEQHQDLCR